MVITRIINGNRIDIELTEYEMVQVYQMKRDEYLIDFAKDVLESEYPTLYEDEEAREKIPALFLNNWYKWDDTDRDILEETIDQYKESAGI